MKNVVKTIIFVLLVFASIMLVPKISKADEPSSTGNLEIVLTTEGAYPDSENSHKLGMDKISEVYYSIKNSSGEYLCFDSSLEYSGKQSDQYIITISNEKFQDCNEGKSSVVTLKGIPNGDYVLEFVQKDGSYISTTSLYNDFTVEPSVGNKNISIDGSTATINTSILFKAVYKFILYYIDETGTNPEIYWRLGINSLLKFSYRRDSEGNNVYEWTKDGTIEDIKIVSGERTIVVPPIGSSGIYNVSSKVNPDCRLLCTNGYVNAVGPWSYERKDDFSGSDSIGFPHQQDLGFAYVYTCAKKAYTINKVGNDGKTVDSKFILYNGRMSDGKRIIFDYYENYELNGVTYENVYAIKGIADGNSEIGQDGVIQTKNGSATIIYPLVEFDGGHIWSPTHFCLYEAETSDDYMFYPMELSGEIVGEVYGLNVTLNGQEFPSSAGRITQNAGQISYNDIEVAIDSDIEDEIVKTVVNEKKPSVTKIVLDENGNVDTSCTDTFKFGLFKTPVDYQDDYMLIATVELNANETKTFDVQTNDINAENYYRSGEYIIAEFYNNNYYVSNAELTGYDGQAGFIIPDGQLSEVDRMALRYNKSSTLVINAVFTNMKKTMPSVTKHVLDINFDEIEDCDDTFEFLLLNDSFEIVSRVEAKANEEKFFDAYNKLYKGGEQYYIVEIEKKGYVYMPEGTKEYLPYELRAQLEEELGQKIGNYGVRYECNFENQPSSNFYNMEKAKIIIKKEIENVEQSDDEFTFAIYNAQTLELITKIDVKAGETVKLNCEMLGIENGTNIIIAEENKAGYELISLADIDENIGQKELLEFENDLNIGGMIYNVIYYERAKSELYSFTFINKANEIPTEDEEVNENTNEETSEEIKTEEVVEEKITQDINETESVKTSDSVIVYEALLGMSLTIVLCCIRKK